LAALIIRGSDATKPPNVSKVRPTPFTVASAFTKLFPEVDILKIVDKLQQMGFDLMTAIDLDEDAIPSSEL